MNSRHTIIGQHSFKWLNATQFLGALNDNLFKLLLIFFLIDLEGPDACYVEGVVEGLKNVEGCLRYDIRVTREVFKGVERKFEEGPWPSHRVYPLVNGTPTILGRITDGVVKIEEEAA